MDQSDIPHDDLLDVQEMAQELESYISKMLHDSDKTLAMSALMSATINCMLAQCKTLDEVVFYRNVFIQIFDVSIRNIKIKKQE
jgi:hypothetical protein